MGKFYKKKGNVEQQPQLHTLEGCIMKDVDFI